MNHPRPDAPRSRFGFWFLLMLVLHGAALVWLFLYWQSRTRLDQAANQKPLDLPAPLPVPSRPATASVPSGNLLHLVDTRGINATSGGPTIPVTPKEAPSVTAVSEGSATSGVPVLAPTPATDDLQAKARQEKADAAAREALRDEGEIGRIRARREQARLEQEELELIEKQIAEHRAKEENAAKEDPGKAKTTQAKLADEKAKRQQEKDAAEREAQAKREADQKERDRQAKLAEEKAKLEREKAASPAKPTPVVASNGNSKPAAPPEQQPSSKTAVPEPKPVPVVSARSRADLDAFDRNVLYPALYQRWNQPRGPAYQGRNFSVTVRLGVRADGTVVEKRIVKGSGQPAVDASVQAALDKLRRTSPLPASASGSHSQTFTFVLD